MGAWIREHLDALPSIVRGLASSVTTASFTASVAILGLAVIVSAWHGDRALRAGETPWLTLFFAASLFVNAAGHVGQALLFRGYVPGLVTAVAVCIPYCLYGYGKLRQSAVANRRAAVVLTIASLVAQPLIAALALLAGIVSDIMV